MGKTYVAEKDFRLGEINKEIKKGTKVDYDESTGSLCFDNKTYKVLYLKSVIKAQWLKPEDMIYPELDGPIGETVDEANTRKRKERFSNLTKKQKTNQVVPDARMVGVIQEDDPRFYSELGITDVVGKIPKKGEFDKSVIQDDSRVVVSKINVPSEITPEKDSTKKFEVVEDHYDTESREVSKISSNVDQTIKTWAAMHWTKKAETIDKADKVLLNALKKVETSEKILQRITKKLKE